MRSFVLLGLLFAAVSACGDQTEERVSPDPLLADFNTASLRIVTDDNRRHDFRVYLALTQNQLRQGLMFVRHLPANEGMLFVYPQPQTTSMWMKNTLIPLDMIFVRPDGTIESIAQNTIPESLRSIGSTGPVVAVLELNAGTAAALGIQAGDRVLSDAVPRAKMR